jgi:hypothetical protein
MPPPDTFKELFCERFDCAPVAYEERAFHDLLYAHAKLLAPVIRRLNPNFFAEDFRLIVDLGAAPGLLEAAAEVRVFQDRCQNAPHSLRTRLKLRISGRKALGLAHEVFQEHVAS